MAIFTSLLITEILVSKYLYSWKILDASLIEICKLGDKIKHMQISETDFLKLYEATSI